MRVLYTNKIKFLYLFKQPQYYLWNAFFLIFLITVCGLITFSIKIDQTQGRLQTSFTLLLTSISFKWVINRSLPVFYFMIISASKLKALYIGFLLFLKFAIYDNITEKKAGKIQLYTDMVRIDLII
jgi:hypothetical protein